MNKTDVRGIAAEMLSQLGGSRFIACTGSKEFYCGIDDKGRAFLRFHLCDLRPYLRDAEVVPNRCTITLDGGRDLYIVRFDRYRPESYRLDFDACAVRRIPEVNALAYEGDGIYADQLQDVFEEHTGLSLAMCRVIWG